MGTRLYWVKGPWPRKLALAARPRGGDWLEDEVVDWRRSGVDAILSLLTPGEERDFGLEQEGPQAKAQATEFTSFPIADRQVPGSETRTGRIAGPDRLEALVGEERGDSLSSGSWAERTCGSLPSGGSAAGLANRRRDGNQGAWRDRSRNRGTAPLDRSLCGHVDE